MDGSENRNSFRTRPLKRQLFAYAVAGVSSRDAYRSRVDIRERIILIAFKCTANCTADRLAGDCIRVTVHVTCFLIPSLRKSWKKGGRKTLPQCRGDKSSCHLLTEFVGGHQLRNDRSHRDERCSVHDLHDRSCNFDSNVCLGFTRATRLFNRSSPNRRDGAFTSRCLKVPIGLFICLPSNYVVSLLPVWKSRYGTVAVFDTFSMYREKRVIQFPN